MTRRRRETYKRQPPGRSRGFTSSGPMRATSYLGHEHPPARPQGARDSRLPLPRRRHAHPAQPPRRDALGPRSGLSGRASFRQAFRELVVALRAAGEELISSDRETIRLNTSLCWIDALAVLAPEDGQRPSQRSRDPLLAANCSKSSTAQAVAFRSLAAGRADPLQREAARSCSRPSSSKRMAAHPDASERAEIARRLITFDPTHEGASRILMRALADMGERAAGPARVRALPRCPEVDARCRAFARNPRAIRSHPKLFGARGREDKDQQRAGPAVSQQSVPRHSAPAPAAIALRVGVLPFLATARRRRTMVWHSRSARRLPQRSRDSAGST